MKKYLIVLMIGIAVGATGMYFALLREGTITVDDPIVSDTTYTDPVLQQPQAIANCDQYYDLAISKMWIKGEFKDGTLGVDAGDAGKSIHADFPISCRPEVKHHIFGLNYFPATKRVNPFYYYNLGNIAFGGGAIVPITEFDWKKIDYNIGVLISH